jgi:hypothetical protein
MAVRRGFAETSPYLDAVRRQADSERRALGFLPGPAYVEAARQGKLMVLVSEASVCEADLRGRENGRTSKTKAQYSDWSKSVDL